MHSKIKFLGFAAFAVGLSTLPALSQDNSSAQPAFESASVKPAPEDAPMEGLGWMIGLGHELPPHGLLRMTAPLAPLIVFAYNVQDEVEARAMRSRLPEWAQREKFTIVARSPQDAPTMEQLREMMRNLLADRFSLKAHRGTHSGAVNLLSLSRTGVTGPGLKRHQPEQVCIQRGAAVAADLASEHGPLTPLYCGLELHTASDGVFHIRMIDVTLPEACTLLGGLAGVLGGRGMDPVADNTGLIGKWDIEFKFLPERDGTRPENSTGVEGSGPTFTAALEKQLGLRLRKSTGVVEELLVDHIAQPTED